MNGPIANCWAWPDWFRYLDVLKTEEGHFGKLGLNLGFMVSHINPQSVALLVLPLEHRLADFGRFIVEVNFFCSLYRFTTKSLSSDLQYGVCLYCVSLDRMSLVLYFFLVDIDLLKHLNIV